MRQFSLRLAIVLAAGLLAGPGAIPAVHAEDGAATAPATASPVVAKLNGVPYTFKRFRNLLDARVPLRSGRLERNAFADITKEGFEKILEGFAAGQLAAERARGAGMNLDTGERERVKGALERFAGQLLYNQEIASKLGEPSEDEVAKRYEEMKDQFFKDEMFTFRILYLSTYETYEVKEGDTLRSIAKAIHGDEGAFTRIIAMDTKQPRYQSLEPPDPEAPKGEETPAPPAPDATPIPPKALTKGEILLVPMNDEDAKAVEARAAALAERVRKGELFEELSKKESENESPGGLLAFRPKKDKPYHPAIVEALKTIDVGSVSGPLRTRHGYHLVFKESYQPEGHDPLEVVRERVVNSIKSTRAEDLTTEWFKRFVDDHKASFKVHREALEKSRPVDPPAEERASDTDVIVEMGGVQVDRASFINGFRRIRLEDGKRPWDLTDAEILEVLPRHPVFRNRAFSKIVEERKLLELPEVAEFKSDLEDGILATNFINRHGDSEAAKEEPTEEKVLEFYKANPERFMMRGTAVVSRVSAPLDALHRDPAKAAEREKEFIDGVKAAVAGSQTREQFEKAAAQFVRTFRGARTLTPTEAGSTLLADLPEEVRPVVEKAGAKSITDVIRTKDSLAIYWVESVSPEQLPAFELVSSSVRASMIEESRAKHREQLMDELFGAAKVEVVDLEPVRKELGGVN